MPSLKGRLSRLLGGLVLRRAEIVTADEVRGFRRLHLRGDVPRPAAGNKVQILLPTDDMRTYSPIAREGGFELLGWMQAGGPGARWMREAAVGNQVRFVGPQHSFELPPGPVIIGGDETSLAVMASYEVERPGQVRTVVAGADPHAVSDAADHVGLRLDSIVRATDFEAMADSIVAARDGLSDATVGLTGGFQLIVEVRRRLKARGIQAVRTNTYWVPGMTGLD